MSTIAERVTRGAALLERFDPGWWQRINLDELALDSPCHCILGQLYYDDQNPQASYLAGVAWVRSVMPTRSAADTADEDCGFDESGESPDEYEQLTAAWRELIESRRAAS